MNTFTTAVCSMESSQASVSDVTRTLLDRATSPNPTDALTHDDVRLWSENVERLMLNWLTLHDGESLRALGESFRSLIVSDRRDVGFLDTVPPRIKLLIRVAVFEELIGTFKNTFNLARFAEILGRDERTAWGPILIEMFLVDREIAADEFAEPIIFISEAEATLALGEMSKCGLVSEQTADPKKTYILTTEGRAAASAAASLKDWKQKKRIAAQ